MGPVESHILDKKNSYQNLTILQSLKIIPVKLFFFNILHSTNFP